MKKPELLLPAGSLEVLKIAVSYGADAVYIGGEAFSLRAKARNFTSEQMAEGIAFAHERGVKVYVTANILAHNYDLGEVREYFALLRDMKPYPPDALIISDPGIFTLAGEICPGIDRHISTQANNTNYETFLFWHRLGAKRVVSARELSLEELKEIRAHIPDDMEIETFVHGAMCISYSGRCLLSKFMTGRDANRGECTHPCRWKYTLEKESTGELNAFVTEETRPGEFFPVVENDRGSFIFNSRDLCMIEHIPDLVDAGIDSFKIEGRMKTALYAATMARTYRRAIDEFFEDPDLYASHMDWYHSEIRKCTYRKYTTGFFYSKPDQTTQIYDGSTYERGMTYLGYVEEARPVEEAGSAPGQSGAAGAGADTGCELRITQKNKFLRGDVIELMRPQGQNISVTVLGIRDEEGNEMESAPHAGQRLYVTIDRPAKPYDILCVQTGAPAQE